MGQSVNSSTVDVGIAKKKCTRPPRTLRRFQPSRMLRNSCSLAFPPPESSAILLSRFDHKNVFPVGLGTPCKNTLRPSIFCVIFLVAKPDRFFANCVVRQGMGQRCAAARLNLACAPWHPASFHLPSEPNQQLMSSSVFAGRLVESILFVSTGTSPNEIVGVTTASRSFKRSNLIEK